MVTQFVSEQEKLNNVNDAMHYAGLDFEVEKRPVHQLFRGDGGVMQAQQLKGCNVLYDVTNGRQIGEYRNVVVSDQYTAIQAREWYEVLQRVLDNNGGRIVEAGQYDGGKFSFMRCDFGNMDTPDDHAVRKQLTFRVPHDGKSAARADMLAWRLVCSNGLMGWSEDRIVRIRHSRNYREHMKEAENVLFHFNRYYEWFQAKAMELGTMRITRESAASILSQLIPDNPKAKSHTRTERKRENILHRAWYGPGNHGQTGWDLYNGITEYVDHERDTIGAWSSSLYGGGAKLKQDAVDTILELV